jgi:hypothetical protein
MRKQDSSKNAPKTMDDIYAVQIVEALRTIAAELGPS